MDLDVASTSSPPVLVSGVELNVEHVGVAGLAIVGQVDPAPVTRLAFDRARGVDAGLVVANTHGHHLDAVHGHTGVVVLVGDVARRATHPRRSCR